ncbi:MAG: hypothetical protein GXY34_07150 [Syntrophomonadaceae bacterium]|nr:hypothetical protein [Syntrophomonadaceae bacterium]
MNGMKPNKLLLIVLVALILTGIAVGYFFMGARNTSNKAETTPLTAEELAYFNSDKFFNGEDMNLRNQFLSSLYDAPEKIDLLQLFYNGSGQEVYPTEAEKEAIMAQNDWKTAPDCGCDKISRADMDAVLTKYMGLTLADTDKIGLDKFTYLEKYDAYYHYHGDTNYRNQVTFSSGERKGNIIRLFYTDTFFGDGDKVLTLRENNGEYLFISNQRKADVRS